MTKLDLRQTPISVAELLQLAADDSVLVVNQDGHEFVVEAADQFDREVAQLAGSEKFMSFLAERSKESGSVPIDEVERRLGSEAQ
jgi:hypothetical protein